MMSTTTRQHRWFATPELRTTIRRQGRMHSWIADQINVSAGHFTNILKGSRSISDADARLIASILGADFFALWNVSPDTEDAPERTEAA